eukprot:TRINITY_DN23838_c0_g1_i2.p1 TRINITY_DN23838_c0_g1~~TRINITY_DN23838_c0_g1_i2.p1  ORF type:complete len:338 (+),score=59.24 TRINITY_DN23838_c0_g1_i2:65-1078(+)
MGCGASDKHREAWIEEQYSASLPLPTLTGSQADWQYEASLGVWELFDTHVSLQLENAYSTGEMRFVCYVGEVFYEFDLRAYVQIEWPSGDQNRIQRSSRAVELGGSSWKQSEGKSHSEICFEWQLKNGCWISYEDEEQELICSAVQAGHKMVSFLAHGFKYKIDLEKMVQTNLNTGRVRWLRARYEENACIEERAFEVLKEVQLDTWKMDQNGGRGSEGREEQQQRYQQPSRSEFAQKLYRRREAARQSGNKLPETSAWPPRKTVDLPDGVWPQDARAKKAAHQLLAKLQKTPAPSRRQAYRAACLAWHPDKQPDDEDAATQVFQFLQALKPWYFGA